jgi:FtsP/CotA-like multicopper oxidase with cupredoxin domain
MHGHGMHLPAVMDGGVHQVIAPNSTWSARYRVNQKACTNWYHPHLMGATATQVLMGLGGMIIIDDEESLKMPLPKRYGVDDIPLVIQDRLFTRDGYFAYPQNMMTTMHGFLGDTLLVNGTIAPFIEAENGLLRLRLLNASNARVYNFAIEGANMELIAGDNSFLERPVSVSSVVLSPAERAEVVVNLKKHFNKKLYLVDKESGVRVLEIRVNKKTKVKSRIPTVLTKLEPIDLSKVKRKRKFVLQAKGPGRLVINNKAMDKNRIDERVKVNEWEIWEVENAPMGMGMMRMGMTHNFHMHAGHFRVIKRDGSRAKVKPWERGYKDTVKLGLNERVTLLVRHTDYTDSKHPYMFHCHILEHEDAGMMGQFTVEA